MWMGEGNGPLSGIKHLPPAALFFVATGKTHRGISVGREIAHVSWGGWVGAGGRAQCQ